MAYALVGSVGTVLVTGTNAANTPAFGQTPTANNLLVAWVRGSATTSLPATPSGWSIGKQQTGVNCSVSIYYKIAAGADAAPSFGAVASTAWAAMLAEYSGGAQATPADKTAGASGTTTPQTATAASADIRGNQLVITCGATRYSVGTTNVPATTLNNGATVTEFTDAASSVQHYDFGYGITTGNVSADAAAIAFNVTNISSAIVAAVSFKVVLVNADAPSGGILFGGSNAETKVYADNAQTGGLVFAGTNSEVFVVTAGGSKTKPIPGLSRALQPLTPL